MKRVMSWGGRIAAMVGNRGGPWGSGGSGGSGGDGDGGSGGESGGDGGSGEGGGGPRSPWGRPGPRRRPTGSGAGRSGGDVTSLDDWLKRSRDRLRGGLPGGGGGLSGPRRNWIVYGLIGFAILWVLFTSIHAIPPASRGVVTTFGRYERAMDPGVGFTWPAPISRVETVQVEEIRTIDIPTGNNENLILTGDQNVVDLDFSVSWNIKNPQLFLFQIRDPEQTIREVAESAMRAVISRMSLTDALGAGRGDIATRVQQSMQQLLDEYGSGVRVTNVAVKASQPPDAVSAAFSEVTQASQQAQSAQSEAGAYAVRLRAQAQGDAEQFKRIYEQYRLAPEVTRRRLYYETMEAILARVPSTIIEAPGVTPYLPLPEVQRQAPRQPAQAQAQQPRQQQPAPQAQQGQRR